MTTLTLLPPLHHTIRNALPYTTTALATIGLCSGLYTFLFPSLSAAHLFGFAPPKSGTCAASTEANARQRGYIQLHGIRNSGNGLGMVGLLAFRQVSLLCRENQAAKEAVGLCLGVLLTTGTIVAIGDWWALREYAGVDGVKGEDEKYVRSKAKGHLGATVVIFGLGLGWLLL
jgi:hypothetical protein